MPVSVSRSIWTGDDHDIAIRVSHPAFPVIRPAITICRVSMAWHYHLDAHFDGAPKECFKIIDLEPEQHPVSVWLILTIADGTVIMFNLEAV